MEKMEQLKKRKGPVLRFIIYCLFLMLMTLFSQSVNAQKSYKQLKYPKLRDLKVPEPARFVLKNGMVIYLLEDHELPLIDILAFIKTGSRWEPPDKIGLARLTGAVMRTGGTVTKKGDEIDDELENIGSSVETSIGLTMGSVRMSSLKEDVDKGLGILIDILMNPAFPEDKLELAKIRARDQIARRNDDVNEITRREFRKLIYGASSPYARQTEYQTIDNISRADLVNFHKRFFAPNNMILGAWGDFSTGEMKAKLERAFAGWMSTATDPLRLPEVKENVQKKIYLVNKEDVNQTDIRIGHLGGQMNDPDYYALTVLGEILGGGFSSRLFNNVRSKEGLAYTAVGGWTSNYDFPGIFFMAGQTKSGTTVKAIKAFTEEVNRLIKDGITDQELQRAKDSILNSFVFNFETKAAIVDRILTYEYYRYPKDFLFKYKENVEKVTKADISRVAKKHVHPDRFVILAVGHEKDFDQPLSTLGHAETIDIRIPKDVPSIPVATSESKAKAKNILSAAAAAMGGEKLRTIRDVMRTAKGSIVTQQGEFPVSSELDLIYPNKLRQKIQLPFGEIVSVYNGNTGWTRTPQGTRDLVGPLRDELMGVIFRDTINILKNVGNNDLTAQYVDQVDLDGKKANVVLISDKEGQTVKLYFDATDHLLLKKVYRTTLDKPAEVEEILSDYREVSGIRLPFKFITKRDGQKFAETTITEVKINGGINEKLFVKE